MESFKGVLYMIKRFLSVLLAAIMAFTIVAGTVSSVSAAGTEKPFTVKVTSNFFPEQINSYKDINMYEDENGDVFITVECKLYAPEKIVINFDFELTWDPEVLEYKNAYNYVTVNKRQRLNIFPFLVENNSTAVVNDFGDENCGRMVGNYTNVTYCPYAYNEDENGNTSPITFCKFIFKVLDKDALYTNVNVDFRTISLCDEDEPEPWSMYPIIDRRGVDPELASLYETETNIYPKGDVETTFLIGDVNNDKRVDILDSAMVQKYASDKTDLTDKQKILADVNDDGNVDILDAADIQKYASEIITEFKKK